jgi:hypothetical protein
MSVRVLRDARAPSSERWNYLWARNLTGKFCLEMPTSTIHSRVLLHAVNLRHGTDGFTSSPKEGVLRIFSPLKIRRLRPGLNPRTWVLKANTLPLDNRNRLRHVAMTTKFYGPTVWNFLHVILQASRIFRWLLYIWKIFAIQF